MSASDVSDSSVPSTDTSPTSSDASPPKIKDTQRIMDDIKIINSPTVMSRTISGMGNVSCIAIHPKTLSKVLSNAETYGFGVTSFVYCHENMADKFMLFNELTWIDELTIAWILTDANHSNFAKIGEFNFGRADHPIKKQNRLFTKIRYPRYSYSLADVISCSDVDICQFSVDIVSSLVFMHRNNIWHRDIKPENIMIDDKRRANIIDYSHSIKIFGNRISLESNMVTCFYRAPEVFYYQKNNKPMSLLYAKHDVKSPNDITNEKVQPVIYNELVDVWSFGVVLFGLICEFSLPDLVLYYYKKGSPLRSDNVGSISYNITTTIGRRASILPLSLNLDKISKEFNVDVDADCEKILCEFLLMDRSEYLHDIRKLYFTFCKKEIKYIDMYWSWLECIFAGPVFRCSAAVLQSKMLDGANKKYVSVSLPTYAYSSYYDTDDLLRLNDTPTHEGLYVTVMELLRKYNELCYYKQVDVSLAEVYVKYLVTYKFVQLFNINTTVFAFYLLFIHNIYDISINLGSALSLVNGSDRYRFNIKFDELRNELARLTVLPGECFHDMFVTNMFSDYYRMKETISLVKTKVKIPLCLDYDSDN